MRVQHNKSLMPHCSDIIRIGRLALLMMLMGVSVSCNSAVVQPPSSGSVIVKWPSEWREAKYDEDENGTPVKFLGFKG